MENCSLSAAGNIGVLAMLMSCGHSVRMRIARFALASVVMASFFLPGLAESKAQSSAGLDPVSVSAFANTAIPRAMREGKIPGAAFVVVMGDRVICKKTFGVTDLKTRAPVSPDQTLFRVASISKILTAAAVLQLAHAHRLNLRRNVNFYLTRFHIAPAFGEPVTTADLLTHSAGFDDCQFGYAARTMAGQLSLADYLARYQPARVRPPGLISVYDNYGYALAGYLVQKISGMPFNDYVRNRIFDPLDMMRSSFRPGAALRRRLATGYWLDGDTPRAFRPDYVNITPAAGLCASASDMADFLVALLANRRPDGGQMFPPDVLRGLETRQFAAAPLATGRCYGFDRISLAGRRALRQTGNWPGFDSILLLFPAAHCGIFLVYNLCDNERMALSIGRQFTGQFVPPDVDSSANSSLVANSQMVSPLPFLGAYLSERTPHDTPELGFPREIEVAESAAGGLRIAGRTYRPIGPRTFEQIEPRSSSGIQVGRRVTFVPESGALDLITQDGAYRRVNWADSTRGILFLLRLATWVFLSVVVIWPVMGFFRFISRNAAQGAFPSVRTAATFSLAARAAAFAACALALWFEVSFLAVESRLGPFADFYGFPKPLKHLLWALPALMFFVVVLVSFCILAWRRRIWRLAHRLHYTLLVIALSLFLYAFCSLHLLSV